ncbi:HNH endonuclease [Arthrobacter sp. efr-133-TYG-118]|uniref:HNH endonuclease n=1 Tax=Arthrobacter sp. efr-133-TYG-118 TaxID=3040279 RepID=UPI0025503312|nr:HNH endonuclease [Arthrobacter sp. efr-133-TYG-118]
MAWFKVDDKLHTSRKLMSIPRKYRLAALGLWTIAGSWSVRQDTDGFIPDYVIEELAGSQVHVNALVTAELWMPAAGGWRFVVWRKSQDGDYRPNIRKTVRRAVMERDGYRCVFCGALDGLSLDHIVRYRDDGPDSEDNLRVLCMPCNLERG